MPQRQRRLRETRLRAGENCGGGVSEALGSLLVCGSSRSNEGVWRLGFGGKTRRTFDRSG